MEFYKLRQTIMIATKAHLEFRQDLLDKGMDLPPFSVFIRKMALEYGASEGMIKRSVEVLVSHATVKNGEIVRRGEDEPILR